MAHNTSKQVLFNTMNDRSQNNDSILYHHHNNHGYWPAGALRVVSLDDLDHDMKQPDVHKLFPSESFSTSSEDDSFLTPFEYETKSQSTTGSSSEYQDALETQSLGGDPCIPTSIFTSTFHHIETRHERTSEGIGIIPYPDDCSSISSLDSDEMSHDSSLSSSSDDLWDTDSTHLLAIPEDDNVFEQSVTHYAHDNVGLTSPLEEPEWGRDLSFQDYYEAVVIPWRRSWQFGGSNPCR